MGIQSSKGRLRRIKEKCGVNYNATSSVSSNSSTISSSISVNGNSTDSNSSIFSVSSSNSSVSNKNFLVCCSIDEVEIDIMHIQHDLIRETWKGNFSSPIKSGLEEGKLKVLNVGCGPGGWLCNMSSDYPKCSYVGVDNVELIPNTKPLNVKFIKHDFLQGLPFENDSFDFVYMRFMVFQFTEQEWETFVVRELMRVLKPGGWIELMEVDLKLVSPGPITKKIDYTIMDKLKIFGINPFIYQRIDEFMKDANLINVEKFKKRLPCGIWGGTLGEIGGVIVRHWFLKLLKCIMRQQKSNPSALINEILNNNTDDNNGNNLTFNPDRLYYSNYNNVIGGGSGSISGSSSNSSSYKRSIINKNLKNIISGNNKSDGDDINGDSDDREFDKILEDFIIESNLYKTFTDCYRFIGQKAIS